jgi:hypothetical protein
METDNLLESSENSAERIEVVTFLSKLATLDHDGQEDAAMQLIYSHLYALRMAGRFGVCDAILEQIECNLAPVLLVALLTITAPVRGKLAKRTVFYRRAKQAILAMRGPEATERILIGLE